MLGQSRRSACCPHPAQRLAATPNCLDGVAGLARVCPTQWPDGVHSIVVAFMPEMAYVHAGSDEVMKHQSSHTSALETHKTYAVSGAVPLAPPSEGLALRYTKASDAKASKSSCGWSKRGCLCMILFRGCQGARSRRFGWLHPISPDA